MTRNLTTVLRVINREHIETPALPPVWVRVREWLMARWRQR